MRSRTALALCSLVCAALLSGGGVDAQSASGGATLDEIDTIFGFGDSYSWNGYSPLIGGVNTIPGYGLTTSGGYNWLQFLSQLGTNPITLYDLAASGATTNNSVISAPATDFVNQVGLWSEWFGPGGTYSTSGQVRFEPNSTLYTVWIGINDVGAPYNEQTNFPQQLSEISASYNAAIASLYAGGARNFLIMGIPPTWRTPLIQAYNDSRIDVYRDRLGLYNTRLASLFTTFATSFPAASFRLYDTVPFFNALLDNPQQYGIDNTTAACGAYAAVTGPPEISLPQCGVPLERYAWWNDYHPAWPVHELLASVIGGILSNPDAAPPSPSTTLTSASGLPSSASTAAVAPPGATTTTSASSSSLEVVEQGSATGSVAPSASASATAGGSSSAASSLRLCPRSSALGSGAALLLLLLLGALA
ncbi:hypothetical protein JCM8208_003872 [Rhodotorula glutinis]